MVSMTEEQDEGWTVEEPTSSSTLSDTESLAKNVENALRDRRVETDLLWSIFVSAAKSYRFSSILHPFPPMYLHEREGEKQIIALREVLSCMPQFSTNEDCHKQLPVDCRELLAWLLKKSKFQLKTRDRQTCFSDIRSLTGQVMDAPEPNYIFEVLHDAAEETRFERRRDGRRFLYGYHGSRFDNFYSILNNGLNGHMNKVSVFGEGTYLSSELTVSLLYSPGVEAWSKSCLDSRLACVAVCQMIDDHSVKCQVKDGQSSLQRQRAQASQVTDSVPEKYYVAQNNDMLRVKYLLVYKDKPATARQSGDSAFYRWLQRNWFPVLLLAYVFLLLLVGLSSSRSAIKSFTYYYNRFKEMYS